MPTCFASLALKRPKLSEGRPAGTADAAGHLSLQEASLWRMAAILRFHAFPYRNSGFVAAVAVALVFFLFPFQAAVYKAYTWT